MATVTDGPSAAGPGPAPASAPADVELVQYERYIDRQLQKTRVQVKGVEIAASLITLVVGSLVYLFLVALVDHWVVKGGLGFAGRLLFLLLFLAGAIGYFAVALWPLLVRRINPVYAAQAIERSKPSLKNSLINFLLLRSRPGALPPMVYEAVERQAATGLSQVSVEGAVDRSRLLHVGWALLAIVAVCSLYALVSPKNPLRSFGRVVAPWADIAAPTRVRIADVQPGDGPAFHDQFVTVSAAVSGVTPDEPVTLFYSTADGQVVDQAVAMTLPPGGLRYTAELPPTSGGLQQNVEYHLAAGDAVTRRYKIKVLITPSIVVERVEYEFPRYTEIDPSVAERQGDLKGIEGTRVTIHALANDEIKAAYVDLDCDGRRDLTMQADGRRAKASFALALKPKSDEPEHASYQLRFQNADGEENPRPVRHQIEVIRDLPPEIAFTEPPEAAAKPVRRDEGGINLRAHKNAAGKNATIKNAADKAGPGNNAAKRAVGGPPVDAPQPAEQQLPQGAAMRMAVAASDPDFKLASVKLMAQRNGQALFSNELLPAPAGGPFGGAFLFNTSTLKLAAGDTVTYWAVAEDNKQPDPNRTETPHYTLRITSPEQPQRPQNQVAQNDQKQQQPKPNDKRDPNQRQNQDQRKQGDPQQPSQGQPGEGTPQPGDQSQKDAQRDQQNRDQQRRDQKPQKDEPGEGQAGQGEPGKGQSQKGESSDKNPAEKQQGENNDRGDGKPGQGSQDQGTAGKNQPDKKQPDQSAKPNQSSGADDQRPVDPDAQPGDAIQKIYDRRNQQQQNPADQKDTNDQKQPSEQPTDRSPQDKTNPDQQPGSRGDQSADKKPAGDEKRPDNSAPPSDQSASPHDKSAERGSDASGQGGKPGENPSAADQPADKSHDGAQSKDGQSGRKAEAGKNDAGKPDSPSAADKQGEKTGADKTAGASPPPTKQRTTARQARSRMAPSRPTATTPRRATAARRTHPSPAMVVSPATRSAPIKRSRRTTEPSRRKRRAETRRRTTRAKRARASPAATRRVRPRRRETTRRATRSSNPPAPASPTPRTSPSRRASANTNPTPRAANRATAPAAAVKAAVNGPTARAPVRPGRIPIRSKAAGRRIRPARAKPATRAAIRPKASRPTARVRPAASAARAIRLSRAEPNPARATR